MAVKTRPSKKLVESKVAVTIPSEAAYVRVVRLALTGIASQLNFSIDEIEDLKLAVSEACNNAIRHAGSANGDGQVLIECYSSPGRLRVCVQDHGPGITPKAARKRTKPADPSEGGLGLYLMQTLVDEVHVQGTPGVGTRVELIKYVGGHA